MIELRGAAGVGSENHIVAVRVLDIATIGCCRQIGIGAADQEREVGTGLYWVPSCDRW